MNFRQHLQKSLKDQGAVRGRRWFVKRNKKGLIREIKMVFYPEEYALANPNRKLYGDRELSKIVNKNKEMLDEVNR
jgi:hypothetical protein